MAILMFMFVLCDPSLQGDLYMLTCLGWRLGLFTQPIICGADWANFTDCKMINLSGRCKWTLRAIYVASVQDFKNYIFGRFLVFKFHCSTAVVS